MFENDVIRQCLSRCLQPGSIYMMYNGSRAVAITPCVVFNIVERKAYQLADFERGQCRTLDGVEEIDISMICEAPFSAISRTYGEPIIRSNCVVHTKKGNFFVLSGYCRKTKQKLTHWLEVVEIGDCQARVQEIEVDEDDIIGVFPQYPIKIPGKGEDLKTSLFGKGVTFPAKSIWRRYPTNPYAFAEADYEGVNMLVSLAPEFDTK